MLQRTVRTVAALAHGDADFLDRLRDAGVRVALVEAVETAADWHRAQAFRAQAKAAADAPSCCAKPPP
ncbi:hypothetical protein [Streptomyces sp. NPDC091027]|uniref:hypothetical protein n=1 Tax=Streptomyces sp. NPDC091027 TaxID=3365971 RepID=UPI0037FBFC64